MVRQALRTRFYAVTALLAALLVLPSRALAQSAEGSDGLPPQLELEWVAPPDCDARERTMRAVERLLGASPSNVTTAPLSGSASVTRTADGFHLLLIVRHREAELNRKLEASSCTELSEAAALILALVLDPELLSRGEAVPDSGERPVNDSAPVAEPKREPMAPPVARGVPGEAAPSIHPSGEPARLEPFIELGPMASLGVIPSPAFGVSLSGGFDLRKWRLLLTAAYFPARHVRIHESRASATFELRTIGAALCYSERIAEGLGLGPCLLSDFGSVAALGEGVDTPQGDTKRWGSTGLGALMRYASRRAFELGLQTSAQLPWGRTEYSLAGTRVYQPAPLSLTLRAFVGVRFR